MSQTSGTLDLSDLFGRPLEADEISAGLFVRQHLEDQLKPRTHRSDCSLPEDRPSDEEADPAN